MRDGAPWGCGEEAKAQRWEPGGRVQGAVRRLAGCSEQRRGERGRRGEQRDKWWGTAGHKSHGLWASASAPPHSVFWVKERLPQIYVPENLRM